MATLNLTDPNHPTFSYPSHGATVSGGVECNCPANDTACLTRCQNQAQDMLDVTLVVFPEDT